MAFVNMMSVPYIQHEKTCKPGWSYVRTMVGSLIFPSRERGASSLFMPMRVRQDKGRGRIYPEKWRFRILWLLEGRENNRAKNKAWAGSLKSSYDMVLNARAMQQSDQQRIQILRRSRDTGMQGMGRFRRFFSGYGVVMGRGIVNRPIGCERELRTCQLRVDSQRGPSQKSSFIYVLDVQSGPNFNINIRHSRSLLEQETEKMGWGYYRQQSIKIFRLVRDQGRSWERLSMRCHGDAF